MILIDYYSISAVAAVQTRCQDHHVPHQSNQNIVSHYGICCCFCLLHYNYFRNQKKRPDHKNLSFSQLKDEIMASSRSYGKDLFFDPMYYKPQREVQKRVIILSNLIYILYILKMALSNEAKAILTMDPSERTEEQLHVALVALQQSVDAFGEFPIDMQKSLARVGWYEK